jgi:putative flippase GtrA
VSIVGVVVDIAVAYALTAQFGTPLWLAAVIGFAIAAVGNYILHEFWTFRQNNSSLISKMRALKYMITCAVTLCFRLIIIYLFVKLNFGDFLIIILFISVALSFMLNYIMSKFLVFKQDIKKAEIS